MRRQFGHELTFADGRRSDNLAIKSLRGNFASRTTALTSTAELQSNLIKQFAGREQQMNMLDVAPKQCCVTDHKLASSEELRITHPLQPLSPPEIRKVVQLVLAAPPYGADTRFETIELMEPEKSSVRSYQAGAIIERSARVNVFSAKNIGVTRMTVSLDENKILTSQELPDQRPMIQLEQFIPIEAIVRADPRFITACEKRGITDMSQVCVDPWSAGNFGIPGEEGRHLAHVFAWLRLYANENFYAHPIEGLNAVVDLKSQEVVRVDDYGITPIPMQESNYESALVRTSRRPL